MNAFRKIIRKWTGKNKVVVQENEFDSYMGAFVFDPAWGFGVIVELERIDGDVWVTARTDAKRCWNTTAEYVHVLSYAVDFDQPLAI